jgi:flagellar protein FliS
MNATAQDQYLTNEVLTAAPQKLQLMLIDAAHRFAGRAQAFWDAGRDEDAGEALVRSQEIVTELLGGLSVHREQALVRRVAALYTFVFNCLVDAHLHKDRQRLADALRVLAEERITWQQVCDQLGTTSSPAPIDIAQAEGSSFGFSLQA